MNDPGWVLNAGEIYEFQIRIYDDPGWLDYQNRASTKIQFTVGPDAVNIGVVNGDGDAGRVDTILSLQVTTGFSANLYVGADTTGRRTVVLSETIYTIQKVAE